MATPPTRPRLRERYEGRRSEVIRAAAKLFAERGYDRTTMQDLADAAGLAAGGLYHYVGSKEAILIAICDELMEPLLAAADELAEPGLEPLVQLWVAHVVAHRDHVLVFQQERHVIEREPQWQHVRQTRKRFEQVLKGRLDEELRGVQGVDSGLLLLALLGMVNHLPQWYRPRGRLTPERIAAGFCATILRP